MCVCFWSWIQPLAENVFHSLFLDAVGSELYLIKACW